MIRVFLFLISVCLAGQNVIVANKGGVARLYEGPQSGMTSRYLVAPAPALAGTSGWCVTIENRGASTHYFDLDIYFAPSYISLSGVGTGVLSAPWVQRFDGGVGAGGSGTLSNSNSGSLRVGSTPALPDVFVLAGSSFSKWLPGNGPIAVKAPRGASDAASSAEKIVMSVEQSNGCSQTGYRDGVCRYILTSADATAGIAMVADESYRADKAIRICHIESTMAASADITIYQADTTLGATAPSAACAAQTALAATSTWKYLSVLAIALDNLDALGARQGRVPCLIGAGATLMVKYDYN